MNFREAGRLCEVLGVSLVETMGDWGKRIGVIIAGQRI